MMQPQLFSTDASGVPEQASDSLLSPFATALSLTQPWASFVVLGEKEVETRSWSASRRGPILIHASKGFPAWARELCEEEPFASLLAKHGLTVDTLPLGALVGGARVTDCRTMCEPIQSPIGPVWREWVTVLSDQERALGNYGLGRFGFLLADAFALREPIACRGARSFWPVPTDVQAAVRAARKGVKGGNCNRTDCQKPGAVWFNTSTRAYYCRACAREINAHSEVADGVTLCRLEGEA